VIFKSDLVNVASFIDSPIRRSPLVPPQTSLLFLLVGRVPLKPSENSYPWEYITRLLCLLLNVLMRFSALVPGTGPSGSPGRLLPSSASKDRTVYFERFPPDRLSLLYQPLLFYPFLT